MSTDVGSVYGDLTVLSLARVGVNGAKAWNCWCLCGSEVEKSSNKLEKGHSTTCGKHKSRNMTIQSKARAKYPESSNTRSRVFKIFDGMRGRCTDPRNASYRYYGAVGVSVDPCWAKYEDFQAWAVTSGYEPHLTLDRKDNEKGYSPDNCRWSTRKEQQRNRKKPSLSMEAFGETKLLADWSLDPRCVVSDGAFRMRIRRGWSPERALTSPKRGSL